MHEAALAIDIVDLLSAHTDQLSQITRIMLDIGELSCVDPDALRTALLSALQGTLADGADIVMNRVAAQARCEDCAQAFEPPTRIDPCPHCGSFRKTWLQGQVFQIRSIEGVPRH